MSRKSGILAAIVLAFCATAAAQDSVKTEIKLAKGTTFVVKDLMEWTIEVPMQGAMILKGEFERAHEVLDVTAEGNAKIKATFTRIKLDFNLGMLGTAVYDSNKAEDAEKVKTNPFVGRYALKGETFTFVLSPEGKVVGDVEGCDKIKEKILSNLPKSETGGGEEEGEEGAGEEGIFGGVADKIREELDAKPLKDEFKKEIEKIFVVPSKDARKVGDAWDLPNGEEDIPQIGAISLVSNKLTLTKMDGDCAVFDLTAKMELKKDEGQMAMLAQFLTITKNVYKKSTSFNVKNNMLAKTTYEIELALEASKDLPEGMEGLADLKIGIKGKIGYEITDFKAPG